MAVTHPRRLPSDRRQRSAVRSAAASGFGPTRETRPGGRWPGAVQKFALFGEVLETGIIVTFLMLPVITLPLALAVGHRHLDRFLRAEATGLRLVWRDIRAGILGALGLGTVFLVLTLLLVLDVQLGFSGTLPGGEPVGVVGALALAAASVVLVRAAASWSPVGESAGWRAALRAGALAARTDLVGSLYLLVAVALTVLATWMLPPLLVPALGCLAFASVTVAARASVRRVPAP